MPIYLDHNATTPPAPAVVEAVLQALRVDWANPSSAHAAGQDARRRLAQARAQVAAALGCKPAEVVFTSGATEATQMALRGALMARAAADGHAVPLRLAISTAEHAAARRLALSLQPGLQAAGGDVDWLPLRPAGDLDLDAALARIGPRTAVVSLMAANNETGALMPLQAVAEHCRAAGAWLHVDATQWIGRLPFSLADSGADLVSLSAHKFNGPKGVGALLVRQGLALPALQPGAQERGRRGGTENLPGIAGMAAALQALQALDLPARGRIVAALRDRLQAGLCAALPGTVVFAAGVPRLPNTLLLRFAGLHADAVLGSLQAAGVMASSGAACSAGGSEPSHVLTAMGVPREQALGAVRLSLGMDATAGDIDEALLRITTALRPLLPCPLPTALEPA
ncbi:MAG: cysteine desulfurase [Burkholderiales bacterium]|nr:cysteine desulfurase [Burkholderiales bacterium]